MTAPATTPAELERERLLCERARSGDRSALAELLRQHGPRLYRSVLLPRLGSVSAAEEALSQTYVTVVERIGRFEWRGLGFYPWLRSVGWHVAIDQLRRRRKETLFEPSALEREFDEQSAELPADALEARDLERARQRAQELLATINPRYAQALRLRVFEGQPRELVAQTMGVSVATFDVLLHRATAALQRALSLPGDARP